MSFIPACGPATNPFTYLVPTSNKQSFEASLSAGRAAFDEGDYEASLAHAERAIELNPDSEEAGILYGYSQLGVIGVTPMALITKLMSKSSSTALTAESSSGDTLNQLSVVLGITDAEFALLGTTDVADPSLPVIIPVCAEQARGAVDKLGRVNAAILALAAFVDTDAKISGDVRHGRASVETYRSLRAKSHFVWAFTHLTEALAFNKVLSYTTNGGTKSNLEQRADKLKSQSVTTPDQMSSFVNQLAAFDKVVAKIMPTSGTCEPNGPTTMLKALLNDMLAVNRGFGKLSGVPESLTASISKAMSKIEALQSSVDTSAQNAQAQAMKGQLTTKITATINDKLNELAASGQTISAEDQTTACCAVFSISGGDAAALPDMCKANPPTAASCAGQ